MTKKEQQPRDKAFVRNLDTEFVECRSLRHAYRLVYFGPIRNLEEPIRTIYPPSVIIRQTQCLRCGTLKEDFFNSEEARRLSVGDRFSVFYRRYRWPNRYLWSKRAGVEKPHNSDYNQELYDRFQRKEIPLGEDTLR